MSLVRIHFGVLLCLVALLPKQATGAEAPLTWKFAPGDEHHYRMNQKMDMTMDLGPAGEMKTGVTQIMDMVWKVEAVDEKGGAKLSQQMKRVQMDVQAPGQAAMKYDTDSAEEPTGFATMLAPMFKALVSAPFKFTMSPRGEIHEVEIPEKIAAAVKGMPGGEMMGNMMTDKGFKQMMQQAALVLPKPEELIPGHEWTTSMEMPNPQLGKITTRMTFTYKGSRKTKGQELEVFVPKLEMEFGDGNAAAMIKVEDQKTSGEILFNRTAGRLESSLLNQDMTMVINAGGREMKQKMTQKVEMKRLNAENAKAQRATEKSLE